MPGKLVVHGFNEMVIGGTVDILLNDEKVGSVERGETAEFPIQKDSHLVVKCGINPLKAKLDIQNGMRTEIQCKYNRLTGAVQAQIVSVTPYEGTQEEFSREQAIEEPLRIFDGGLKDVLYMYEDRVVISHRGALNALAMGIKGDKTIYYADITSIQHKKPGFASGYIQFSIPGGNESRGGIFSAMSDENTIALKSDAAIMHEAKEVVDFLNQKVREAKAGAHAAPTVIQQAAAPSAADELKKFKELLDMGAISQEEYDAKKKQLLGL